MPLQSIWRHPVDHVSPRASWGAAQKTAAVCMLLLAGNSLATAADDPLFSGPQAGEALPALKVSDVQWKGKTPREGIAFSEAPVAWLPTEAGQPTLLIFIHELTRPGIALGRVLTNYADQLDGAFSGVVFLTDDATDTRQWMQRAQSVIVNLRQKSRVGLSVDGIEGPGAYGLNRNVQVTVLVANKGKVTANFALVQPSVQADGLKIATALATAAGAKPPTQESMLKLAGMRPMNRKGDRANAKADSNVNLRPILGPLLNKQLTDAEVAEIVKKIEAQAAKDKAIQKAIGQATSRILGADKLQNYGSKAAQKQLKAWAEKWGPKNVEKSPKSRAQPNDSPAKKPERGNS